MSLQARGFNLATARAELSSLRSVGLTGALLAVAVLLACDGCQARVSKPAPRMFQASGEQERDGSVSALEEGEPLVVERRASRQVGRLDFENRYASTVIVTSKLKAEGVGQCSGVLLGRRLVLTAGHCVCQRKRASIPEGGKGYVIDGASCANTATVETLLYNPVEGGEDGASALRSVYPGVVHPHPDFKLLLDAQGHVAASHADLALIELEGAVEEEVPGVSLADEEVHVSERILIVGYGYDEIAQVHDTYRRFSVNKVTEFPLEGGERGRVEQAGGSLYRGDSGGPCLREGARESMLVGISSRNLGEGSTFTSTYAYRNWLRGEIQRVQGAKPPRHSD